VNLPADRHIDNRWNRCLDALIAAWNQLGPDALLAEMSALTGDPRSRLRDEDETATEEGAA